jgi:hypothetical protein
LERPVTKPDELPEQEALRFAGVGVAVIVSPRSAVAQVETPRATSGVMNPTDMRRRGRPIASATLLVLSVSSGGEREHASDRTLALSGAVGTILVCP